MAVHFCMPSILTQVGALENFPRGCCETDSEQHCLAHLVEEHDATQRTNHHGTPWRTCSHVEMKASGMSPGHLHMLRETSLRQC